MERKKITKLLFILLALLTIFCLAGCNSSKKKANSKKNDDSKSKSDTVSKKKLTKDEQLYEDMFDINNKISVKIDISDEELQKIEDDFHAFGSKGMESKKSPIYRIADKVTITVKGTEYVIEDVGIRMKGNTSRSSFYDASTGINSLINYRLSFNETFDKEEYYGEDARVWDDEESKNERKDRTFATLKKMELKYNCVEDTSYISECYCLAMYKDLGILAQRCNLSAMNIGGKNLGIYKIYEGVDKIFIQRNLDEGEFLGDLYKGSWNGGHGCNFTSKCSYGVEDNDDLDPETVEVKKDFALKTNEKTSDNAAMANFISTVNKEGVTKDELDKVMDSKYFALFAAIGYASGNWDDLRNLSNNLYVYFDKDGKAVFIPYDIDQSFDVAGFCNSSFASAYSDMSIVNKSPIVCPIYYLTILEGGYYTKEYDEALDKVLSSKWLDYTNFQKYFETVKSNYSDYIKADESIQNFSERLSEFDISGGSNIPIEKFFDRIKTKGEYGSSDYNVDSIYLLSQNNTCWNVVPDYELKKDSTTGYYTIDLSIKGNDMIHILDNGTTYGFTDISPENTVKTVASAGRPNCIGLYAGDYTIFYDQATHKIWFETK